MEAQAVTKTKTPEMTFDELLSRLVYAEDLSPEEGSAFREELIIARADAGHDDLRELYGEEAFKRAMRRGQMRLIAEALRRAFDHYDDSDVVSSEAA
jgi:hypothetical protein